MEILLICLSAVFILLGIAGSFLPILPGPITGWVGLLLLHQTARVPNNTSLLISTFIIALVVFLIDYIIPILGTKKFGGSKKGMIGATLGVLVGLVFLGPLGVLVGPFVGAYLGELLGNPKDSKKALKAAFGSLIGFLTGVFLPQSLNLKMIFHLLAALFLKMQSNHNTIFI